MWANKQIIGPTQIDREASRGANRLGGCQSRSQWKQRQTDGGKLRTQQHAHVKSFTSSRIPLVIAAPAAGQLLISQVDRTVRRPAACGIDRIGVRGVSLWRIMQLARKDSSGKHEVKRRKIVHGYAVSAAMRIEMFAALAEWVSAPTLMKST